MPYGNYTRLTARQYGFVLMGMFMLIMLSGLVMAQASMRWQTQALRERERELIRVGRAYRDAIGRYYNQTPGIVKTFPPTLEALVNDTRFPTPRRHLRKMYRDPITQREVWGFVSAPSGGIMGVYSLSEKAPFKINGYRGEWQHLNHKHHYLEWYFVYLPPSMATNAAGS